MTKKEKQWLAGRLLGLGKRAFSLGQGTQARIESDAYSFGLDDDGEAAFRELSDRLLNQHGWAAKYSERYLDDLLLSVIGGLRAKLDYKDAVRAAEQLEKDWSAFRETRHVYVPIDNLDMTLTQLQIGRARLTRLGPARREDFERRVRKAFEASPRPPEERELAVQSQLDRFQALGRVVSIVDVVAEPRRAYERAYEETRRALDFLNYGVSIVQGSAMRQAAGILGDGFRGRRDHFAVTADFTVYHSSADFATGVASVRLDSTLKKTLVTLGMPKISSILSGSSSNDFEEAVIQALHWYADAWLQPSPDNELLGLITALETFFTRPDQRITTPLAEGAAFVLADNLASRKAIAARIRHFYRLRGTVTHGGKQPITPTDVNELRYYVQHVISVMITNLTGWTSLSSLHDWLEDRRLS